jgi:AmmeMemoRadiSam system protein B/uncharacterized protein (TIGR00296 family)
MNTSHLKKWFNADTSKINSMLEKTHKLCKRHFTFNKNPTESRVNSIVVPHAGFQYSGLCAMSAYHLSYSKNYKRILVLATDHQGLAGLHYIKSNIQIGNYFINVNTSSKLLSLLRSKGVKIVKADDTIVNNEHALLNHIPLIHYFYKDSVSVIPFIVGKLNPREIETYGKLLAGLVDDTTLVICSTDLNHINGTFSHKVEGPNTTDKIRKADSKILRLLMNGNKKINGNFVENINTEGLSPCGIYALALLKELNKQLKLNYCNVACYYTSRQLEKMKVNSNNGFSLEQLLTLPAGKDTADNTSNAGKTSVGYLGALFSTIPYLDNSKTRPLDYLLTSYEKKALHFYMVRLLNAYLENRNSDINSDRNNGGNNISHLLKKNQFQLLDPFYCPIYHKVNLGLFVTLKGLNGRLRGCIGTTQSSDNTIISNLQKYTYYSAFKDSRFEPLTMSEFKDTNTGKLKLKMYISLLTKLKEISYEDYKRKDGGFVFQKDGIVMTLSNGDSAFFLPSVAQDYNLSVKDADTMLSMLCEKIGHSKTCFREHGLTLSYNEGIEF